MKRFVLYIIIFFTVSISFADEETQLDSAKNLYTQNKYFEAQTIYQNIVDQGYISLELYYNLGNCYYKMNNLAPAIYYYEKALKLSPNDEETRHNLRIAYYNITDQVQEMPEIFYLTWFKAIRNLFSSNTWTWISVIMFILCLSIISVQLLSNTRLIKRIWLLFSIITGILFISSFVFALSQKKYQKSSNQAIVFESSMVKSSPSNDGNNLFEVHEGLKVQISDTLNNWTEIKLADGKKGWIVNTQIKRF